eukprot:352561-Chlamydomonas_euryale.AAC.11
MGPYASIVCLEDCLNIFARALRCPTRCSFCVSRGRERLLCASQLHMPGHFLHVRCCPLVRAVACCALQYAARLLSLTTSFDIKLPC